MHTWLQVDPSSRRRDTLVCSLLQAHASQGRPGARQHAMLEYASKCTVATDGPTASHVLQVMSTSLRHRQATDRSGQVGSAQGSTTNPVPIDEPYNTLCGMQTTTKTLCRKARSECIAGKGDAAGLGRQPPP